LNLKGGFHYEISPLTQTTLQTPIQLNSDNGWYPYLRARTYLKLNTPNLAQTDLQQAISLAQGKYEKNPTDWQNTFNLALYHLAANHSQESDYLYQSGLNAPSAWLEMAIQDLTDFLNSFPDHHPAQQIRLQLEQTLSILSTTRSHRVSPNP
jgi:hypothetical protein